MRTEKTGTLEELKKDIENSGIHLDPDPQPPLEVILAQTRMRIDEALTKILTEAGIPLFLFDYLISSVQNDIRKADLDLIRSGITVDDSIDKKG